MSKSNEDLRLALEHSRALFIYHAGQRILSLNYYFLAIAVFLSGFGFMATSSLTTASRALVGSVLSVAGIFLTTCFKGLDQRNVQLVECAKRLLTHVEREMATLVACDEWNIMASADNAQPPRWRYGSIVPRIFNLYIFLRGAGGIFAVVPWAITLLRCH